MKFVLFILATVFVVSAQAQNKKETCGQKLATLQGWQNLTGEQTTCMENDPEYKQASAFLCNSSNSDFSTPYKKYLEFEKKHLAAFKAFQEATDLVTRNQAAVDMRTIERDWSGGGYRNEVATALNTAASIKSICAPH
jgi:hypothetical protein